MRGPFRARMPVVTFSISPSSAMIFADGTVYNRKTGDRVFDLRLMAGSQVDRDMPEGFYSYLFELRGGDGTATIKREYGVGARVQEETFDNAGARKNRVFRFEVG